MGGFRGVGAWFLQSVKDHPFLWLSGSLFVYWIGTNYTGPVSDTRYSPHYGCYVNEDQPFFQSPRGHKRACTPPEREECVRSGGCSDPYVPGTSEGGLNQHDWMKSVWST